MRPQRRAALLCALLALLYGAEALATPRRALKQGASSTDGSASAVAVPVMPVAAAASISGSAAAAPVSAVQVKQIEASSDQMGVGNPLLLTHTVVRRAAAPGKAPGSALAELAYGSGAAAAPARAPAAAPSGAASFAMSPSSAPEAAAAPAYGPSPPPKAPLSPSPPPPPTPPPSPPWLGWNSITNEPIETATAAPPSNYGGWNAVTNEPITTVPDEPARHPWPAAPGLIHPPGWFPGEGTGAAAGTGVAAGTGMGTGMGMDDDSFALTGAPIRYTYPGAVWVPTSVTNTGAFDLTTASETPAERAAALMPQVPTAAPAPVAAVTRAPINLITAVSATPVAVGRLSSFLTNAGGR